MFGPGFTSSLYPILAMGGAVLFGYQLRRLMERGSARSVSTEPRNPFVPQEPAGIDGLPAFTFAAICFALLLIAMAFGMRLS